MDDKSFTIRVPKRWARIALIVSVVAMIVAPLTAVAGHGFNDVPSSHTFHDDIGWLADAGVTKGCNPPANTEFCPEDNVTRGQMGAFMRRFAQYIGAEDGTPAQADNANNLDGKNGTAYETIVVADGCRVNTTVTATSCTPASDGSIPDQTTIELGRASVNAPSNGTIVIDGFHLGPLTGWYTLNEACAPYGTTGAAIVAQMINGIAYGGNPEPTASASTAIAVTSGNQTIRHCGVYTGIDGLGQVLSASLVTTWTTGGNVTIAEAPAASGTSQGLDGLLGN